MTGAVDGRRQAEAGRHRSGPPRAADPRRYRQRDGAGASGRHCSPIWPGSASTTAPSPATSATAWSPPSRNSRRTAAASRPACSIRRSAAAGRDREAAAGQCRLEDRHRCRHRRSARHSGQTGAAAIQRRQWRQMELAHRHHPDSVDAAQGGRSHHRETRRAREEGAGRTQHRLHRGQAGFLRAVGHAGPEEILPARHLQGRRGPHPDHSLRSGHRKHRGAGGDRDVERVQSVSDRRAVAGPPPRKTVEYGTGIVVSEDGAIIADRADHRRLPCDRDSPATATPTAIAEDKEHDLALLRIYGARGLKPLGLSDGPAKSSVESHRHRRSAKPGRRRGREQRQGIGHAGRQRQRSGAVAGAGARFFRRRGARWRRQIRRHRAVEAGAGRRSAERHARGAGRAGAAPIPCATSSKPMV